MDGASMRILYIFIDIILPLAVGYVLKQRQLVSSEQCNRLIRFNIIVIVTILTLLSFWVMPLRAELLSLPFFAFFNAFFPLGIILVLHLQKRFSLKLDRGSYLIAAIPSNTTALGGLCGYLLYGEIAFAYSQIIGIFQNLVMFFILFPMGYYYQHSGQNSHILTFMKANWKGISSTGISFLSSLLSSASGCTPLMFPARQSWDSCFNTSSISVPGLLYCRLAISLTFPISSSTAALRST